MEIVAFGGNRRSEKDYRSGSEPSRRLLVDNSLFVEQVCRKNPQLCIVFPSVFLVIFLLAKTFYLSFLLSYKSL